MVSTRKAAHEPLPDPTNVAIGVMRRLTPTERMDILRHKGFDYPPGQPPAPVPAIRTVSLDFLAHDEDGRQDYDDPMTLWVQDYAGEVWRVRLELPPERSSWLCARDPDNDSWGDLPTRNAVAVLSSPGWMDDGTPRKWSREERIARDRDHARRNRERIAATRGADMPDPNSEYPPPEEMARLKRIGTSVFRQPQSAARNSSLWVPTRRAAELLGVSANAIRNWLHRKPGLGWKDGGKLWVRLEDVIWRAQELAGVPPTVPLEYAVVAPIQGNSR